MLYKFNNRKNVKEIKVSSYKIIKVCFQINDVITTISICSQNSKKKKKKLIISISIILKEVTKFEVI